MEWAVPTLGSGSLRRPSLAQPQKKKRATRRFSPFYRRPQPDGTMLKLYEDVSRSPGARMTKNEDTALVPTEQIGSSILLLRGCRVILDRDLAAIYGVKTGRLNEAVKRNADRFPGDFMFQLTREEVQSLRSQFAILNAGPRRGVFTPRIAARSRSRLPPLPMQLAPTR